MNGSPVAGRMFVVDKGDDTPRMWWRAWWCPVQLSKWRIRKAPEGAVPPWRNGHVAPEVLAGEDGRVHGEWSARWWVWAPDQDVPIATASSQAAALEIVWQMVVHRDRQACESELLALDVLTRGVGS